MARIFISYRRLDSGAYVAGNLRDAFEARFGAGSVFLDINTIPFGVDFRQYIGDAVGQCDVLLVIIGDYWLQSMDEQGKRRLEDPADYVRIEIESALKRNIAVVPVLVGEAKVPRAGELPESIRGLVSRHGAEIRATVDQKNQIERLVSGLAQHFGARVSDAEEKKPAAAAREKPSAIEPREAMDQLKVRESVEPKPPAAVSGAGMEKSATPEKEKQAEPQLRETIARPKVRESAKRKLQAAESVPAKPTPVISQSDLDQQAAFLEKAREAFDCWKPSSVLELVRKGITSDRFWFSGAIPPEKASSATKTYAPNISQDAIMLLYDDTTWGGAKDGLLLTMDAIYWHTIRGQAGHCRYADVQEISIRNKTLLLNNKEARYDHPASRQVLQAVMNLIRNLKPELQVAESTIHSRGRS